MNIKQLITIFFIAAFVAAVSGCLSEKTSDIKTTEIKPTDVKPVEIMFSAASSLQDAMKDIGAEFRKIILKLRSILILPLQGFLKNK